MDGASTAGLVPQKSCSTGLITMGAVEGQMLADTNANNNSNNNNNINNSNTTGMSNNVGNEISPNNTKSNPEFSNAVTTVCRERLRKAASGSSIPEIKCAIQTVVKADATQDLGPEMEAAKAKYRECMQIPQDWDIEAMVKGMEGGRMLTKKPINDAKFIAQLQTLLDQTLRKKYTLQLQVVVAAAAVKVPKGS